MKGHFYLQGGIKRVSVFATGETPSCEDKLTFDIQHSCGRAAACRAGRHAAVLALVSRSGISNRQHRTIRTDLNIV